MPSHTKIMIYATLVVLFAACGNGKNNDKSVEEADSKKLLEGTIVEKVKCSSNPNFSYTYYLPTNYDESKLYPIIIIFDAHARAYLSVSKFKKIAEEYGYILVASGTARNGLQNVNEVVNSLWQDVSQRFKIDHRRVYTAGFSGGAKVASLVAIYKGGVSGVIACGAGMPSLNQEIKNKFDYAAVVGLDDFNYQEIKSLHKSLEEYDFKTHLFTFDGAHEFPPTNILEKAVMWLNIMHMKRMPQYTDNQILRSYSDYYSDTINRLYAHDKLFATYNLYSSFIKDMQGLYDVSEYTKGYNELSNNEQVKLGIKKEQKIKEQELKEQELILSYFKTGNYSQIEKTLVNLTNNTKIDLHLKNRLTNLVSMICYIYLKSAVDSKNMASFANLIKIYSSIKENKAYADFFRACKLSIENKNKETIITLQESVNNGYYDIASLSNTSYFNQLKKIPEFDLIVKKAESNSRLNF